MRDRFAHVVLAGLLFSLGVDAVPSAQVGGPPGIVGRVVAAHTGVPLRRVRIESSAAAGGALFTDGDGRFVLRWSGSETVTVTATKAGYAAASVTAAAASTRELRIVMERGAAISGRVVDAGGVPLIAAPIVARRIETGGPAGAPEQFASTTDDVGEYRLGGLPPGRYAVTAGHPRSAIGILPESAMPPATIQSAIQGMANARRVTLPPVPIADAALQVEVRAGDEMRDVTIALPRQPDPEEARATLLARVREIAAREGRQPPDSLCFGSGAIHGRVVSTGGAPVPGVTVRASRRPFAILLATTDSGGAYAHGCVEPGEYTLEAGRSGFVPATGGRTFETTLRVADGQRISVPDMVFDRASAVTGLIVDEDGEPVQDVAVRALEVRYTGGRVRAVPSGVERRTDDRGEFRLYGLPPGAYVISASVDASSDAAQAAVGYAPVYYPGISEIDAAAQVHTTRGVDVTGLTLVLRPSVAALVSGSAVDSTGAPAAGSVILAASARSAAPAPDPIVLPTAADGTFAFPNVPPGDYVVHAIATPIGRIEEFGSEHVVVTDRQPPPVSIRTMTGGTVEGRLAIDGGQPKDAQSFEYTLMAYPIDPDRAPFVRRGSGLVIRSDGTFYAVGLYGPRVLALAAAPPDWYVKSVTIGGVDVTDSGFDLGTASIVSDADIVLSAKGAIFAGRIVDGRGEPVPGSVIAFPVQRTYWTPYSRYLKHARAASDGAFEIRGLPPGEYWLAAVETLDAGVNGDEWQNPLALDALASRAERATLGESERRTVELPLLRPAR